MAEAGAGLSETVTETTVTVTTEPVRKAGGAAVQGSGRYREGRDKALESCWMGWAWGYGRKWVWGNRRVLGIFWCVRVGAEGWSSDMQ